MELISGPGLYDSLFPLGINASLYSHVKACYDAQNSNTDRDVDELSSHYDLYSTSFSLLTSPLLGISQTCGSNLTSEFASHLTVLGVPIYDVPGCNGTSYSSLLITNRSNHCHTVNDVVKLAGTEGLVLAVNSFNSCSGWYLFLAALNDHPIEVNDIRKILQTGSHIASVQAIDKEEAQLACIDCISFALIKRYHPQVAENIQILGYTPLANTPPFVTSSSRSIATVRAMQEALRHTFHSDQSQAIREQIFLRGIFIDTKSREDYDASMVAIKERGRGKFSVLLDGLHQTLREHQALSCPTGHVIEVLSTARRDDECWPRADKEMMAVLSEGLMSLIVSQLSTHFSSSDPGLVTPDALREAVEQRLLRRELWAPMPRGGQAKVICCSLQGVLSVLALFSPLSEPQPISFVTAIQSSARALLGDIEAANEMFFATFMGAASEQLTTSHYPASDGLLKDLWAADFALSERLISEGERLGIFAYVSAPRHNDRHDWSNLVLARDCASLLAWRHSAGHSATSALLAPSCYEHIRLHRGTFSRPRNMKLLQTIFLHQQQQQQQGVSRGSQEEMQSLLASQSEIYYSSRLRKSHSDTNDDVPSHQTHQYSFRREVIAWSMVPDDKDLLDKQAFPSTSSIAQIPTKQYYEQLIELKMV